MSRQKPTKIKKLYRWLTWQADLEAAVAELETRELRELNGYLARRGVQNGIPALIQGLIHDVASKRLMYGERKGRDL